MENPFAIVRVDGRSNSRVLLDLVKDAEPGRIFTYGEIAAALSQGTARVYDTPSVQGIVADTEAQLLKEQQRTLYNLRNTGYRVAHARDHNRLAVERRKKADMQLRRGLQILQNVRFDEMTENERNAHQAHLMIASALYTQNKSLEQRQRKVEDAIQQLHQRVDDLQTAAA